MFGKKPKPLTLDLVISPPRDRRRAFRVWTGSEEPVIFEMDSDRYQVVQVSACGLIIQGVGGSLAERKVGRLLLPDWPDPIPVEVVVKRTEEGRVVAVEIEKISRQDQEMIHHYVLNRQKNELAGKKER
jgi:hypothetical protein